MASDLPLIGAQAVILGMNAFNANARTVVQQLRSMNTAAGELGTAQARSADAAVRFAAANDAIRRSLGGIVALKDYAKDAVQAAIVSERVAKYMGQAAIAAVGYAKGLEATAAAARAAATASATIATRAPSTTNVARARADEAAAKSAEKAYNDANKAAQRQIAETVRAADDAAAKRIALDTAMVRQQEELYAEQTAAQTASLEAQAAEEEAVAARVAAVRTAMFVGIGAAVLASVAVMAAAEKQAATYNKQLNDIAIFSGASATQVKVLDDAQISMARTTSVGANELVKFSDAAIRDSLSIDKLNADVLKAGANMIILSNGELKAGEAAKIQAQGINTFGATAAEVANASTAAVTNSTITWQGYSAAISNSGAVMKTAGLSIEEFSALVATAGKTMADGSAIGSGLRQMFERLTNPTEKSLAAMKEYGVTLYDAQGHTRPLIDILRSLEDAFGTTAVATGKINEMQRDEALTTIFSARTTETLKAILDQGTLSYLAQVDAQKKMNAEDLAHKSLAPTSEQAKILANSISTLALAFGKGLDPAVRDATADMNDFVGSMKPDAAERFGSVIGDIVTRFREMSLLSKDNGFMQLLRLVAEGPTNALMGPPPVVLPPTPPRMITPQNSFGGIPIGGWLEETAYTGQLQTNLGLGFPKGKSDKTEKDVRDAIKETSKVAEEFNRAWAKLNDDTTKEVSKLYVDTYDRIDKLTAQNTDTIRKANEEAVKQVADIRSAEAVRKNQEERKKALDDTLKDAATTRRIGLEQAAEDDKRRNEDADRALKEQTVARDQEVKRGQEDESRIRSDGLAHDEERYKAAQKQREQDLKDWQAIEERSLSDHQKQLELNLREDQQARETALKQDQTRREAALKDQLDNEERMLKDSQRAREETLNNTFKTETARQGVANDLQKVLDEDKRARDKAQREYEQDIVKGVRGDIAQKRLDKKLLEISGATAEGRTRVADRSAEDQRNLALEKSQQERMDALKADFEKQDTTRTAKAEQARRDFARDTENETLALRNTTENETFRLAQDTEGKLAALRETQERARTALANQIADEELTHNQTNAKAEADFKRGQEDAYIAAKKIIDATELEERRKLDDADLAHKEQLQQDETTFQEGQAAARLALEQRFQDEDLARRLAQIGRDRDARIAEANTTLATERQLQLEALARQVGDLRANLTERADVIRTEYIDKLAGILDKGGDAVKGRVDQMAADMNTALDSVGARARAITDDVAAAFDARAQLEAAERRRAAGPPLPPSAGAAGDITNVPTMQYGGVVPGRYGASQWIIAHGGERFEGLGALNTTLASVRAAEAMWQRGIGGSHYVTNQYSYNVDAHYGRTQDEGSVARDLSALVMLTRN